MAIILKTRSSAAAHGGAASRENTQGNAVEVHRSLPGRSRSPPKVKNIVTSQYWLKVDGGDPVFVLAPIERVLSCLKQRSIGNRAVSQSCDTDIV